MCEKYNGWTNYETWNFALWHDLGSFAEDFSDREVSEDKFKNGELCSDIADYLQEWADEMLEMTSPELANGANFFSDIFGSALRSVNWYELAEHVIDAIRYDQEN